MGRIHTYAVIPARDEEDYIGSVINDIAPLVKGICIVNDDSADRTANIARETLHSHPQLQIAELVDGSGKGPGAAVRRGIQRLRELGVSDEHCCVIIDGDGQIPAEIIPQAAKIVIHADTESILVKGIRTYSRGVRVPIMRRVLGKVSAAAASLATGMKISDAHCGFAAARLETMNHLACDDPWDGYGYPVHWILKQKYLGGVIETVSLPAYYGDEKSSLRIHKLAFPLLVRYFHGTLQRIRRRCSRVKTEDSLPMRATHSISET